MRLARHVALISIVVALVALCCYLLYRIMVVIILLAIAILLATAVEPLVLWLRRGPLNRAQGILVAYTGIFAVLGLLTFLIVVTVGAQGGALAAAMPASLERLHQGLDSFGFAPLRGILTSLLDQLTGAVQQPATPTTVQTEQVKQVGASVFAAVFDVVTVFVLAFYWLTERTTIKRAVTGLFDIQHRPRAIAVWTDIEERLGGWVRGQLVLMVTIGAAGAVGWTLIGVPFALVLAILAGMVEVIPVLGPWLGTAPAVLIAFTVSPEKALMVLAYGVAIQLVEANVLVPRVMRESTGISPLTVLLGILIGSTLGGIVGALLAVPFAATLQVLLQNLHQARNEAAAPPENGSVEQEEAVVGVQRA